MRILVNKYPELPDLEKLNKPQKDYADVYQLERRTYLSGDVLCNSLPWLNYEVRSYSPCGGCWNYHVIYIYNDSINFILPLLDSYYYHLTASDKPKSFEEIAPMLSFENELNLLLNQFPNNNQTKQCLIQNIMTVGLRYQLTNSFDLEGIFALSDSLSKDNWYNNDCHDALQKNKELIKESLSKSNTIVYHQGWLVYLFEINKDSVKVELLNYPCYKVILL